MEIQMEKLLQLIGEQTVELSLYKYRIQDMAGRIAELERELERELEKVKPCQENAVKKST